MGQVSLFATRIQEPKRRIMMINLLFNCTIINSSYGYSMIISPPPMSAKSYAAAVREALFLLFRLPLSF